MVERIGKQMTNMVAGVVLVVAAILFIASFRGSALTAQATDTPDTVVEPEGALAVSQVLNYQGRLLSPSTGLPKPDGDYQMTFSIYNVLTGGAPLWTETQTVPASNGFFSALLGGTTVLPVAVFNGQELFLGVTLAGDPEMTPRQRLAHIAYAMRAEIAGSASNANRLDNIDSTGFALAAHNHSGEAINSGTVADARIAGTIARDSEIFPAVLAADGSGSGLDADTLDGLDSSSFFPRHRAVQYNGTLALGEVQFPSTHSWPLDWDVVWSIVPSTSGGQIYWYLSGVYFDPGTGGYTYIFRVENTGSIATNYTMRYSVLR
jgi:hypothetical protein